ncbi:superinfection immunity protein [Komagataeibacter sp. FNDCF1]|uniref:superinfection immunity protein n=1 Tax=Komagataeibacter sp. FNDCF1 TaxID=2878681 RepID=UPI001E39587B|nr:superinfection immunity protein [Komagataeibacter sp. FNDCF1]MCE2564137.1 superinfection immunity protein [Komagataeibacter sp. FNDCF1]
MKITGGSIMAAGFVLVAMMGLAAPASAAVPDIAPLAHAELGERTQARITAEGIEATLRVTPSHQCNMAMAWQDANAQPATSCDVAQLVVRDLSHPQSSAHTFVLSPYGQDSGYGYMKMALYRLDAASSVPQVMVSAYTGGAHCCEVSSLFGQMPDGTWRETPLGQNDGDGPPTIVDAAHDGTAEILGSDQSFLYTFASYAGSVAPVVLQRYHAGTLETVTRDPAYRPFLVRQLADMQKNWMKEDQPEPNGFLAYYVATMANIGEFGQGWRYMLAHADPTPDDTFGISACDIRQAEPRACTPAELKPVPFPQGLAFFLQKNGYITAAQAGAVPMVLLAGQDAAPVSGYRPDFSCVPPPEHNGVAVMLCHDSEAARHELLFDQVYYALRQQVGREGWKALRQQVIMDENAVNQGCGLPVPGPTDQSVPENGAACYGTAMDRLADAYRQQLKGAALEESRRPLDIHIALQQKLVELGYLPAGTVADGVYGEATRDAITAWQRATQRPETSGFLSDADAQALLPADPATSPAGGMPVAAAAPAPAQPAAVSPAGRPGLGLFGFGIGVVLLVGVFGAGLYFLPFGVACMRDSTGKGGILAVNVFFGWTLLGWVTALVMAVSFETRADHELRRQAMLRILSNGTAPDNGQQGSPGT